MNIAGGTIRNCSTESAGGAIYSGGSTNIYGGTFCDNSAGTYGGAIYSGVGTLTITGGTFYSNYAQQGGGAIHLNGRSVKASLAGADIYSNRTGGNGSGVLLNKGHLELGGDLNIDDNDLYWDFYSTVNGDDLADTAFVNVTPEAMTVVASQGGKEWNFHCADADYLAYDVYGKTVMLQGNLSAAEDVTGFQVGFGEANITPETIDGMPLQGYSNASSRLAVDEGREAYDDIYAQAVAITDETGQTVILIYCDLITCNADLFDYVVDAVAAATGVPEGNIFLNFSHSHSVPSVTTTTFPIVVEYNKTLPNLFARSALQAMNDRQPATMETGSFEVQQTVNGKTQYYNFYRHYSYEEDGIVKYFGDQFGNATYNSTTKPVRDADHTMHLVRFTRSGKDILMANWRIHPHFTGGESKYLLSADAIGTIRYYMKQNMPDTHFIYFQGAAGNMNESSRMTTNRYKAGLISQDQVQHHGLGYVAYGKAVAGIIVKNLDCLESTEPGLLQVDHYDYLAKIDTPTDAEYANAKALYDIYVVETAGMLLSEKNAWVRQYCAEHPEYDYSSSFQLGFIVNRRYKETDTYIPLNVVSLGKSFALFTGPFEMWDSISMEVEEKSPFKTTFCLGYSMAHYHYLVYYPEYTDMEDGVPYVSYESENRHFVAPDTVLDMIDYWTTKLNEFYLN